MSSPDAATLLFVVAFVLLADLLRLVEVVVDVALCVVQLLRDVRHAQAVILLEHDGLGELGVLGSDPGERRMGIRRAVQLPGFFTFTSLLLTYGINLSRIVNDICQKGDVYAKASQMPQDRTASGLPQLFA